MIYFIICFLSGYYVFIGISLMIIVIKEIPFVARRFNDLKIIKNHYLNDFPILYGILTISKPLIFILLFNSRLFYDFFGLIEKISYLTFV